MKNNISILTATTFAALTFTGCGSTFIGYSSYTPIQNTKNHELTSVVSGADGLTMLTSTMKNRTAFRAFQVTTEQTLGNGDRYFSIIEPTSISNQNGNLMNTAEEYVKECADNNTVEAIFAKKCLGIVNGMNQGRIKAITYKEKPDNIITYDADQALRVIKSNEFYKPLSIGTQADAPNWIKPALQ